jgi:K+-sensing histidine kinase KdpD
MKAPYKKQLAYSIFLTLAIPGLLIGTVVWNIRSYTVASNKDLQQQAFLLADSFAPTALANMGNAQTLSNDMLALQKRQPLVREITLYRYTGKEFVTVASTDSHKSLQILNDVASNAAWSQNDKVASVETIEASDERVWSVVSPLRDGNGNKIALLQAKISTKDIDGLTKQNFNVTILIVGIEIFLILLLLVNYFQFASYPRLYFALREVDRIRQVLLNAISLGLVLPAQELRNNAEFFSKTYAALLDIRGREYTHAILEQATKLMAVITSIGDYSKIEHGASVLSSFPLHFEELCDAVSEELVIAQPPDEAVLLNYQRPDRDVVIEADVTALHKIMFTFVSLLLRYSNGGSILLRFEFLQSGDCKLIIDPANLFIGPEVQENFFQPNSMISTTVSNTFADLGVIYVLSAELIRKMGGHLGADFDISNKATFWITFPLSTKTITEVYKKDLS